MAPLCVYKILSLPALLAIASHKKQRQINTVARGPIKYCRETNTLIYGDNKTLVRNRK